LRQYHKNIGKEVEVLTTDGRSLTGVLVKADESSLELEHPVTKQKKEIKRDNTRIPSSEIKTVKIVIKFRK
jgi:ribosome maturation factor RimP